MGLSLSCIKYCYVERLNWLGGALFKVGVLGTVGWHLLRCLESCASCLLVALHGFCCLIMDINSTLVALRCIYIYIYVIYVCVYIIYNI